MVNILMTVSSVGVFCFNVEKFDDRIWNTIVCKVENIWGSWVKINASIVDFDCSIKKQILFTNNDKVTVFVKFLGELADGKMGSC